MLRLPAVAGRFYPAQPAELKQTVQSLLRAEPHSAPACFRACLVPHAGYVYSGHVAAAVYARMAIPRTVIVLGVRHYPHGERAAINSSGAWRTPLGDAPINSALADELRVACPLVREDTVAHASEHSLEVQLPFLQCLRSDVSFVPIALGNAQFEELAAVGSGIAHVLQRRGPEILLLTSSDLNHYEDDATTHAKDSKAIDQLLALDARSLYETCLRERISMCGLSPAVAMLSALRELGGAKAELVRHATSGDVSGERAAVVGYAGMLFA